jgi:Arylsulfotransferase (ASST)
MATPLPTPLRAALLALSLLTFGCGPDAAPAPPAKPADQPVADPDLSSPPGVPDGAAPPGRWLPRPGAAAVVSDEETRALDAIGYMAGTREASGAGGVVVSHPERVQPGINLVVSGHACEAALMDADGRMLHTWARECRDVFPELKDMDAPRFHYFRRARLLPDGALLVIFEGVGLFKLARDSTVLWAWPGRAHHDLDVRADGRLLTLSRKLHVVPRLSPEPLIEDFVVELSAEGEVLRTVSLFDALEPAVGTPMLAGWAAAALAQGAGDVLHANTSRWLTPERVGHWPLAQAGDVLLSMRNVDLLALLKPDDTRVTWKASGDWRAQHQPELQPDGRLLLFDNARGSTRSRALEIDPSTSAITWSWSGTDDDPLWSATCGSVQGLANGNVLVVESDGGRAFEVARDGTVVWRFDSPWRAGERGDLVATLFDCMRLPPDAASWLR